MRKKTGKTLAGNNFCRLSFLETFLIENNRGTFFSVRFLFLQSKEARYDF